MDKIIKIADGIDQEKLSKAEELQKEVLTRTYIVRGHLVELGRLFKTIRDGKYYKYLGADTFDAYCADPAVSFGRSTIYSFIKIYEVLILRDGYTTEFVSNIGHRNCQLIMPLIKEKKDDEWVWRAKTLSESDLINEVRRAQNKPELMPKPKEKGNEPFPFSFEEYLDFVKTHACVVCGEEKTDNAHFPRSRGAGGRDTDVIPLCRKCHTEAHNDFYDFLWLHKDSIFRYFYNMVLNAYSIIRRDKNVR